MPGVTDPALPQFKDGVWGWDGSQWRKLPMVWGYSDRWGENVTGTASGASNALAQTAAVPAGYVYVLQQAEIYHNAAAAHELRVTPIFGAIVCSVVHNLSASPWVHYTWVGELTLKEGDKVEATVTTPGDGKTVHLNVWGYKMKVAE